MPLQDPKPIKTECTLHADIRDAEVEINLDEVLEQFDDDDIAAALDRKARRSNGRSSSVSLLSVYEEFARRGDAPKCLRDFLYMTLGRTLP